MPHTGRRDIALWTSGPTRLDPAASTENKPASFTNGLRRTDPNPLLQHGTVGPSARSDYPSTIRNLRPMRVLVVVALTAAYFSIAFLSYGQVDAAAVTGTGGYGVMDVAAKP